MKFRERTAKIKATSLEVVYLRMSLGFFFSISVIILSFPVRTCYNL